jgi:hypothetical protein
LPSDLSDPTHPAALYSAPLVHTAESWVISVPLEIWTITSGSPLIPPSTLRHHSFDGHLFGFFPYRMGIAPTFQQLSAGAAAVTERSQAWGVTDSRDSNPNAAAVEEVPQMCISSNISTHPLATLVLIMPLTSSQPSPTPTAANVKLALSHCHLTNLSTCPPFLLHKTLPHHLLKQRPLA